MSKNVAVFVDVANIFYAAKAAGVDIDYVTLLKSATAGRDFVRAYAYTGLDPENENQRQFHNFLARSGYKVISKDIRKYGDGRIKANLDIELVVDLMKTARNLDIAVIVSGDGDFAPAIRAVQETGVRCEVISFRGNTSSDLIDVADQFTDIAQIARVEKGSARSGRRVATEGDLSMTEVPEKETEGAPRRRRGGRAREEAPVAAVASAETVAAGLVALPGERLSRAPEADELEAEAEQEGVVPAGEGGDGRDAAGEEARRRRRRRGGRGRGRGRRDEEAVVAPTEEPVPVAASAHDEDEFEELPPTQPPHHTFGSVWDSQLGVPTASLPPAVDAATGAGVDEDEDEDEPEVPEYLLAERRQRGQQGQRGVGRGPRGRSAYQAALDRERFGRGTPQPSGFGANAGRTQDRDRDRGRDRPRGGRPQQGGGRPPARQPARPAERQPMSEQRSSSEPWSEVPPELEELLRAELARKQPANGADSSAGAAPATEDEPTPEAEPTAEPKPARRRRTTKAAAATEPHGAPAAEPSTAGEAAAAEEVALAPAKRATRKRATTTRAKAEPAAGAVPDEAPGEAAPGEEEPKKPVRRRRTTAKASADEG